MRIRRAFVSFGSADDVGLQFLEEIIAMIRIDLERDRLGQIQAEDAQNRFPIHDMTTYAQVDIVGIAVCNVDKGLHVLGEAQLDIDCLHNNQSPN